MALFFPLQVEEPPRRPRQPVRSHLVVAAGFAMSIVYFWGPFAVMAVEGTLPPRELVGLATAVISLVFFLQSFLLYRLVSQTRICPTVTDPIDAFFYESRAGSVVLLCLCVPWCVMGAFGLILSLPAAAESLFQHHGREDVGRLLGLVFSFITVTTPLALSTGLWWASHTAFRSLYRALTVDAGRGQYEGVPLGLDEPQSDEQQFQRGMRAVTRIFLFAAALTASTVYYWMPMKLASRQKGDPLVFIMQSLVLMLEGCLCYGLLSASRVYSHVTDVIDSILLKTPPGHMFLGMLAFCAWALGAGSVSLMVLFVAGKTRGTRHDPPPPEVSGMGPTERMMRIAAPFALVYAACWLFCLASVGMLQIAPPRRRPNGDVTWGDLLRRPAVSGTVLFIIMASRLLGRVVKEFSV